MEPTIPERVQRLIDLLDQHGEESWGAALRNLISEYDSNPDEVKANIRRLYGGMGSFNDIVFQDKNGALGPENNELDRMRSELFAACSN